MALQVPQSASSSPGTRLIDKFPSTTSLWQILRRFESGVAGGASTEGKNYNFTQCATLQISDGTNPTENASGSGRLCYEMPTLNITGRQLETISDLSRTLQQLGVSGNVMIRLEFKTTTQPLEEAMEEITKFFGDIPEKPAVEREQNSTDSKSIAATSEGVNTPGNPQSPDESLETLGVVENALNPEASKAQSETDTSFSSQSVRNLSIFSAPSNSTPIAASSITPHNEADYIPTKDHARSHQANLARAARNKRLLTDAETANQRKERDAQLSQITHIIVRLRFPDQSSVQKEYGQLDTLHSLYDTCRAVLDRRNNESFQLYATSTGGGAVQGAGAGVVTALQDGDERLIRDLSWMGRVLVTVGWASDVSEERRAQPSLKAEFRAKAEELKVKQPAEDPIGTGKSLEDASGSAGPSDSSVGDGDSKSRKVGDKEAKLKKLFGIKK